MFSIEGKTVQFKQHIVHISEITMCGKNTFCMIRLSNIRGGKHERNFRTKYSKEIRDD